MNMADVLKVGRIEITTPERLGDVLSVVRVYDEHGVLIAVGELGGCAIHPREYAGTLIHADEDNDLAGRDESQDWDSGDWHSTDDDGA